jgi:ABC-type Fe3+-hydroxamate transport system substrate-binding protein
MVARVVSLVPSITETLRAWGLDPIACTRFCEQPDLATVGGTKNPDIDAIVALRPDVVTLDAQENRREDADALSAAGIELVVLDVVDLVGLDAELAKLADVVGLPPPAAVAPSGPPASVTMTAFVPIWRRPWMTIAAGTYGSAILAHLGVANLFADADTAYPVVELDEVAAHSPDLVLVPSEPYDFQPGHLDELRPIAPVVEVDGQDLFWWGARTPAALDRLAATLRRA